MKTINVIAYGIYGDGEHIFTIDGPLRSVYQSIADIILQREGFDSTKLVTQFPPEGKYIEFPEEIELLCCFGEDSFINRYEIYPVQLYKERGEITIGDVSAKSYSKWVVDFINNSCITYKDMVLKENLFNVSDFSEVEELLEEEANVKKEYRDELLSLNAIQNKHGYAYLRFVNQ